MEGEGSSQQGAHDAQHGEFREGRCQEGGFREKQVLGDMEGQGQGKHQLLGQEAGRHPQGSDGVKDEHQQIQEGTQMVCQAWAKPWALMMKNSTPRNTDSTVIK